MRQLSIILFAILLLQSPATALSEVDHISLVTTPIFLYKDESLVAQGSGFYYMYRDEQKKAVIIFLVTNYHVLTGHAPNQPYHPKGNNIVFYTHTNKDNPASIVEMALPIFTNKGKPIWITSKDFVDADVAMIPLPDYLSKNVMFCLSKDWIEEDIKIRPGFPVTLISYPMGYYDKINKLPIWKTGNIASEPDIDFEDNHLFLIDAKAVCGMSGCPVFAMAYGVYEKESDDKLLGGGIVRKFLGIYSGMWAEHGIELVGHVWKANIIEDIISSTDFEKYDDEIINENIAARLSDFYSSWLRRFTDIFQDKIPFE